MSSVLKSIRDSSAWVVEQIPGVLAWRVEPVGVARAYASDVAMTLALAHVMPGEREDVDPEIAAAEAMARSGATQIERLGEEMLNRIRLVQAAITAVSTDGEQTWIPCTLIEEGEEMESEDPPHVTLNVSHIDPDTFHLISTVATKAVKEGAVRVHRFRGQHGPGA